MQITIDTTTDLTDLDRRVLAALVGEAAATPKANPITALPSRETLDKWAAPKTSTKEVTIEEPEPAPTEKPRRTRKSKPAPEPEPVQEPEEVPDARPVDDDAPATPAPTTDDEPDTDGPTVADALELASQLVAEGRSSEVKEVLAEVGVKRVRDLGEDQVATFIAGIKKLKG